MGTTGFLPNVHFPGGPHELPAKCESAEAPSCHRDDPAYLDDDVNSTLSESSSGIGAFDQIRPSKMTERQTPGRKTLPGHESDVDSGIVSCQVMDNQTESISSSETDSNRESAPNEQKPRPSCDLTQCVRFDEQLHLSEENIRRSCRKLFSTLYAHRFSYPCYSDSEMLTSSTQVRITSSSEENTKTERVRVPFTEDLGIRCSRLHNRNTDNYHAKYGEQRRHYPVQHLVQNTSVCSTSGAGDISFCGSVQKAKPEYRRSHSSIVFSSPKLTLDSQPKNVEKTDPTLYSIGGLHANGVKSPERNILGMHSVSGKDQFSTLVSANGPESRRSSSFLPLSLLSPRENSYSSFLNSKTHHSRSLLHKSLSCTVLSASENMSLLPCDKQDSEFSRRTSNPISISSLNISDGNHICDEERRCHLNVALPRVCTRNGMIRAYARIVPIVPDDSNSSTFIEHDPTPSGVPTVNSYNSILLTGSQHGSQSTEQNTPCSGFTSTESKYSSSSETRSINTITEGKAHRGSNDMSIQESSSYKDLSYFSPSKHLYSVTSGHQKGRLPVCDRNSEVIHRQRRFLQDDSNKRASPKILSNECIPASLRGNVSADRSLNHLKRNGNHKSSKPNYDVLDQSQKNRFNSLPVLDNLVSVENQRESLPTHLKRCLHQSDFTLYQNRPSPSSSSSRKSFLDRIQGFTRSAKNAVQKAFSTERIYRPEREERYEAEGQKLKRSYSFIRGLRERMSKRKKKEKKKKKSTSPQVVTQERLNTSWNESVLGPGAMTHVEGQLLQLNPDGSQVIELTKPPSKPYGFFVARGRIRNSRGVFVSRMRDQETEEHLTGLLGIGDEILEIEGLNVKHADILEVNNLMAQRNSLILTVLPYVCRKD